MEGVPCLVVVEANVSRRRPFLLRPHWLNHPRRFFLDFRIFFQPFHGNNISLQFTDIADHPVEYLRHTERITDGQADFIRTDSPAGITWDHGEESGEECDEIPCKVHANRHPTTEKKHNSFRRTFNSINEYMSQSINQSIEATQLFDLSVDKVDKSYHSFCILRLYRWETRK